MAAQTRGGGRDARRPRKARKKTKRSRVDAAGRGRRLGVGRKTAAETPAAGTLFPRLAGGEDCAGKGVFLALATRAGKAAALRCVGLERIVGRGGRPRRAGFPAVAADPEALARMLQGLAHAERIRLLEALEQGAETHQALSAAVHLKPGPFYHHLRELERAGLVHAPARNRYELTERGLAGLMVCAGLWTLTAATGAARPWRRRRVRVRVGRGEGKA